MTCHACVYERKPYRYKVYIYIYICIQICVHKYIGFKNGGVRVNIASESLASSLVLYQRALCSVYIYIIYIYSILYYIRKLHSHSRVINIHTDIIYDTSLCIRIDSMSIADKLVSRISIWE